MEFAEIWRFALAFFVVCALIGLVSIIAKRYFRAGFSLPRQRESRLAVTERLMLDPRHQLLIIRRDNKEHLIIQHPQGVSIVEQGFNSLTTETPVIAPNLKRQSLSLEPELADEEEPKLIKKKAPYFSFKSLEDAE